MKEEEIIKLVEEGLSDDDLYFENAKILYLHLRRERMGHFEQLLQLVKNGPIWDGDIISKSHRNDLLKWKLAVKCTFKGEQGYTSGSYYGWSVLNADRHILEDSYNL